MALYAALTDGTDTVYLRRCQAGDALLGYPDGYEQKVARRNDDGSFEELTETWKLRFSSNTDADRADELIKLGNLRQKIWRRRDLRLADEWVWLEVQTPTENARRYAIASDIFVPTLAAAHYHDNALPDLTLEITREGVWRPTAPNLAWASKRTGSVLSTSVKNYWDSTDDNLVDLGLISNGDSPAIVRATLTPPYNLWGSDYSGKMLLALKSFPDNATLQDFNPHFNAADGIETGKITDSEAPGGQRYEINLPSGGNGSLTWDISATSDVADYAGRYMAYAVCNPTTTVSIKLRMIGATSSEQIALTDYVSLDEGGGGGGYANIFMGIVTLPPSGHIPDETYNALSFSIEYSIDAAGGTLSLRNWYLVPYDEGVCGAHEIEELISNDLVIDGDLQRIYIRSDNNKASGLVINQYGSYFTLPNNRYCAVYYFGALKYDGISATKPGGEPVYDKDMPVTIDVEYFERYQMLRD